MKRSVSSKDEHLPLPCVGPSHTDGSVAGRFEWLRSLPGLSEDMFGEF
jgi:hypothetical protein